MMVKACWNLAGGKMKGERGKRLDLNHGNFVEVFQNTPVVGVLHKAIMPIQEFQRYIYSLFIWTAQAEMICG